MAPISMTSNPDFKIIQRRVARKWYKMSYSYNGRPIESLSNGAIFNDLDLANGYRYGHSYYKNE